MIILISLRKTFCNTQEDEIFSEVQTLDCLINEKYYQRAEHYSKIEAANFRNFREKCCQLYEEIPFVKENKTVMEEKKLSKFKVSDFDYYTPNFDMRISPKNNPPTQLKKFNQEKYSNKTKLKIKLNRENNNGMIIVPRSNIKFT